jgi:hypothetical protein
VTSEQWFFAAIYHLGSLVLVVSICLQIFWRIDSLYPAILGVGLSRIVLGGWQMVQPDCSKTDRTPSGLTTTMVVWASTMLLLIWAHNYGSQ